MVVGVMHLYAKEVSEQELELLTQLCSKDWILVIYFLFMLF